MLIQLETENLVKEKITPNDYIILKLLFDKNYDILKQLFDISSFNSYLIGLEDRGYLKLLTEENVEWNILSTQIALRQKTTDLFIVKQTGFYKFWSIYPIKAGSRVLKTGSVDSKEAIVCKQKWDRITHKNPLLEDQIIKGLEIELQIRKRSNSLEYMQLVTTWLNQQTWEKYVHLIEEEVQESNERTESL
jgi:hypothetical protein